jgi:hypothetical protein
MKRRSFTLLEIIIAFTILAMSSTLIGVNLRNAIQKKKFTHEVSKFKETLLFYHKLSMTKKEDWTLVLKNFQKNTILECISEETSFSKKIIFHFQFLVDERQENSYAITFFSSGHIKPMSEISLSLSDFVEKLSFNELFAKHEGSYQGPIHPNFL